MEFFGSADSIYLQQDHMGTHIDSQCPLEHSIIVLFFRPWLLLYQLFRYFIFGDGVLLTSLVEVCILTSVALLDIDSSQKPLTNEDKDSTRPENVPDLEIIAVCLLISSALVVADKTWFT
jgi:choline dehydrogenase